MNKYSATDEIQFKSLEEQSKNTKKLSDLRLRREPEKLNKKISQMINTVSEKLRHHVDIVQNDDYEYLQWISKDTMNIEHQAREIKHNEANVEYEYFKKDQDAFQFKVIYIMHRKKKAN